MRKKIAVLLLLFVALFAFQEVDAQCSMCRYVSETAGDHGSGITRGLNNGILYILGIPYLLIMGVGFMLFRKRKQLFDSNA